MWPSSFLYGDAPRPVAGFDACDLRVCGGVDHRDISGEAVRRVEFTAFVSETDAPVAVTYGNVVRHFCTGEIDNRDGVAPTIGDVKFAPVRRDGYTDRPVLGSI